MGCHTWFSRPLTKDELLFLKDDAKKNLNQQNLTKKEYELLIEAINKYDLQVICDYGKLGEAYTYPIDGWIYLDLGKRSYISEEIYMKTFNITEFFHDNFRVNNYPNWIIHNTRQLRRKMKKKWYSLSKEEIEDIHRFFKLYPGGIITFG